MTTFIKLKNIQNWEVFDKNWRTRQNKLIAIHFFIKMLNKLANSFFPQWDFFTFGKAYFGWTKILLIVTSTMEIFLLVKSVFANLALILDKIRTILHPTAKLYIESLQQCFLKTGPRTIYGLLKICIWSNFYG